MVATSETDHSAMTLYLSVSFIHELYLSIQPSRLTNSFVVPSGRIRLRKIFRSGTDCLKFSIARLSTSWFLQLIVVVHQLIYAALVPSFKWHHLTDRKIFLGPVWHVALVKNCLMAVAPHHGSLRNFWFKVGVSVPEEAQPNTVFVLLLDIGRRNADGAAAGVVVGINQVGNNIHPAHGAAVRQICSYFGLDCLFESLDHGRLLIAFTGKMLNTVAFHPVPKVRVDKRFALVGM